MDESTTTTTIRRLNMQFVGKTGHYDTFMSKDGRWMVDVGYYGVMAVYKVTSYNADATITYHQVSLAGVPNELINFNYKNIKR
jgi:hypothetical protein